MTLKIRGGIPMSIPHPQRTHTQFSPSPDAYASPLSPQGRGERTARHTPLTTKAPTIFTLLARPPLPSRERRFGLPPHTPNCHAELILNCHAELVSASRIFYKQRQADKWNNEILKQVQDDTQLYQFGAPICCRLKMMSGDIIIA